MRLSEQFCRELAHAFRECVHQGRFANAVLQKKLSQNRQWDPELRSLFAESLYFIIRHYTRLLHACGMSADDDAHSALRLVLGALRLQRLSIPSSLQSMLRSDTEQLRQRWQDAENTRTLAYSIPEWLDEMGSEIWSSEWPTLLAALQEEPKVCIRCNELKITPAELRLRLELLQVKMQSSPLRPEAIIFLRFLNVFSLNEFRDGLFEVQDAGSQCIAPFCDVSEGMRVIDACAGSGGKSLHLAALMHNTGRIISMDTEEWKLTELSKRARRDGVSIIETRHISSTKVLKRLHDSADRVLLDVPCSGLGVLRRNPDTKWHVQKADIDRFVSLQRDILDRYSLMVRPGGKVIYATCSILPQECEKQVQWFLSTHPGWELEEQRQLLPHVDQCDGFFMARLRRAGGFAADAVSSDATESV